MPFYKTKRAARYWWLRERHLSPAEAREFSRLHRKYPAVKAMIRSRGAQWAGFKKQAKYEGWSPTKQVREWRAFLKQWYEKSGWMVTKSVRGKEYKHPRPSPWEWYDDVLKKLPPWDRWDTPRSHRRKPKDPDIKLDKVIKLKWVAELDRSIRHERNPVRRAELREQKRRLLK